MIFYAEPLVEIRTDDLAQRMESSLVIFIILPSLVLVPMQFIKLPSLLSNFLGRSKRVCVIGAGVSGLRAAGLLAAAGFDVTILEAQDHIGGRVHQSKELGLSIDLGASWIHGTEGNPLVALAKKTGSTTSACGSVYSMCASDGNWLPHQLAHDCYEEVWEILDLVMKNSREQYHSLSDDAKMMDFFREEVSRRYPCPRLPEAHDTLLRQIVEMWGAFMGNDCERQSLKNLWLDDGLEGNNLFVASTYEDILADLRSVVESKTTLRFRCEVTRVINMEPNGVDIKAADGFQARFDDVVVTTPLGWLKRNQNVFSPPLSPAISSAIEALGYGNLEKIFIRFPKPFWNDGDVGSEDVHEHSGKHGVDLSFPIESLFLTPKYAGDTNPARWRQEIISFSGLPAPFSQPIIMFFVYGQWGRHLSGLVRGMERNSAGYYGILEENLCPYYSKLPNYNSDCSDCKPPQFLATDWQNDRFAGHGSFTNLPVGSGDAVEHFDALRNGMGEDRGIWFAGEHTSHSGGLGTVHGA
ncbi:flavin containing amine oxidoreductase [Seiridium cupressi]